MIYKVKNTVKVQCILQTLEMETGRQRENIYEIGNSEMLCLGSHNVFT